MKHQRIATIILVIALIAAFFSACLFPESSSPLTDGHNCKSEHCIVCIVSALLSKIVERLLLLLWAVLLIVPSVSFSARLFISPNNFSARYTPVFLKVKLLN